MVQMEQKDGALWAHLNGDIDHHNARRMREEIDMETEQLCPKELWLDFRGVTFMDSSGIGLVMGRYKLMQSLGGELRVTGMSAHIKRVMVLAGLDKLAVIE